MFDDPTEPAPAPIVPMATSSPRPGTPSTPSRVPDLLAETQRGRKRSANDVRLKPASPEAISNLLASFSSISLPGAQMVSNRSAPRTPSRHRSRKSSAHQAYGTVRVRDPSIDFAEFKHPTARPVDLPPQQDAAEPPVVRTARPPSGFSKLTASKVARRDKAFVQSNFRSAPSTSHSNSRQMQDKLAPLRDTKAEHRQGGFWASGKASFEGWRSSSRPSSLILTGSNEGSKKGKEREGTITPMSPVPSDGRPQNPLKQLFYPPETPQRVSSRPSTRSSHPPEDSPSTIAGPSRRSRPDQVTEENVQKHQKFSEGDDIPGRIHGHKVIPARNSSLRYSFDAPREKRAIHKPSRSKIKGSPGDSSLEAGSRSQYDSNDLGVAVLPHTNAPERLEKDLKDEMPENQTVVVGLDDDNEVLRRIRELKAAKEQRSRTSGESTRISPLPGPGLVDRTGFSSPQMMPPITQRAMRQLAAPAKIKAFMLVPPGSDEDDLTPPVPPFARAEAPVEPPPLEFGNGTRYQPSSLNSHPPNILRNISSNSVLHRSPTVSRSNSPTPRLSHPKLSPANDESSQRNELSPKQSSFFHTSPVIEERRESAESIQDSVKEFLQASRLSQTVRHFEGKRKITFSEVGDPNGYVVFCCVGMGLTRYVMAFYDELAISLKLRLITPDRPGVGDSDPYPDSSKTPLSWPDDIQAICNQLHVTSFSLLAHSAGAIYALATALRMPNQLRGKIHLLAPWIPPSQLSSLKLPSASPIGVLPRSQRFLRIIPTPFLKLSNSNFFNSAGILRPPSPKKSLKPATNGTTTPHPQFSYQASPRISRPASNDGSHTSLPPSIPPLPLAAHPENSNPSSSNHSIATTSRSAPTPAPLPPFPTTIPRPARTPSELRDRQRRYDADLIPAVWELATRKANPAVDLIVCLERHQPIGFRYVDIDRGVVLHHGSKDTRVPLENVKWLGRNMPRAEVRVLEGEGHGLMAVAGVMGGVLMEVSREWEESGGV